jgi:hypothetical protein
MNLVATFTFVYLLNAKTITVLNANKEYFKKQPLVKAKTVAWILIKAVMLYSLFLLTLELHFSLVDSNAPMAYSAVIVAIVALVIFTIVVKFKDRSCAKKLQKDIANA